MVIKVHIVRGALLALLAILLGKASYGAEIAVALRGKLTHLKSGERVHVVVRFTGKPDLDRFADGRNSAGAMIRSLKTASERHLKGLRQMFAGEKNDVRLTSLWLCNRG